MSELENGRGLAYRISRNERDIPDITRWRDRFQDEIADIRAEIAAIREDIRIRNEWRNRTPVLWISGLSMAAAILMAMLQIFARFWP